MLSVSIFSFAVEGYKRRTQREEIYFVLEGRLNGGLPYFACCIQ